MSGRRTFTTKLACLFFGVALFSQAADYFPLQVGNSWVYQVTSGRGARPGAINVEAKETLNGREYFRVSFFEQIVYLRLGENGNVIRFDKDSGAESVWLPIGSTPGAAVLTQLDSCSKEARVGTASAPLKTILGEFGNALEVRYKPNCADAGVTVQYFLPYIGMLVHETTSIAGPVRYELSYVRSGLTSHAATQQTFGISTDKPVYKAGTEEIHVRLTLNVSEPVVLTFPSGQSSDLRLTDSTGKTVYTWSMDKLFAQVFRQERVEPGERNFVMTVPAGNLAPGRYQVEGWLTTQPRQYNATVPFEIVP